MGRVETNSVIDFGCGVGTWLCAARRLGAREVYGLDGDYVNRDMLLIDESDFHPCNLEEPVTVDRRFDLAISMEVAEHVHEEVADTFVSSICGVSDIILFGAAQQITLIASLYPIGLRSFMNMDIFVWTYESIINMI